MSGGDGNDKMYGGNGTDYIQGDEGNDHIWGGSDRDYFRLIDLQIAAWGSGTRFRAIEADGSVDTSEYLYLQNVALADFQNDALIFIKNNGHLVLW